MDNLAEAVKQAHREYERRADVVDATRDRMNATLTSDEQRKAVDAYASAISSLYDANENITVRQLARHLPGFAPALVALHEHIVTDGHPAAECCEPAA